MRVAEGTPNFVTTSEKKGFRQGKETIWSSVRKDMTISRNPVDLNGVLQEGDWVDWGTLCNKDYVLSVARCFGLGEAKKVSIMVTWGFSKTRTCRERCGQWRCQGGW